MKLNALVRTYVVNLRTSVPYFNLNLLKSSTAFSYQYCTNHNEIDEEVHALSIEHEPRNNG